MHRGFSKAHGSKLCSVKRRLATLLRTWALIGFALLLNHRAMAEESDEYEKQTWATFHHLVDHRDFRPFLRSCVGKEAACRDVLQKLIAGDFKFLSAIEHGDTPDLPKLAMMRHRCADIGMQRLHDIVGEPLKPTSGFALYLVPKSLSPLKSRAVYLSRNEDYRDNDGKIETDGTFSIFTYPECKRIKGFPFTKTHPSFNRPDAPNQETASLAEPIVIGGRVLVMIIDALNPEAPTDPSPLYSIVLWSIVGNRQPGDEDYNFVAR